MYDEFVGFKILETCDLGNSCCVFASLRVENAEDATWCVCLETAEPAPSSSLCSLKVTFLTTSISCAERHSYHQSFTCAGVYKDNDIPVFLCLRRQISITVDALMWLQDHLWSSVDRLWQGFRSGLTDDWRAGPPVGSQVLYSWEKQPSRLHVLHLLKLPTSTNAGKWKDSSTLL